MSAHSQDFDDTRRGPALATLELKIPPGHTGRTVAAALLSQGRVIAQGRTRVSGQDDARIIFHAAEPLPRWPLTGYELWVTLDQDGYESWYPGFSDWFVHFDWPMSHGPWKQVDDVGIWRVKPLPAEGRRLVIHYHRYGGYEEGISLWTWNDRSPMQPVELFETGRDEFGLVFELDKADYGADTDSLRLGLLPRRGGDWELKEDENLYWDARCGDEIYLIGTVDHIWSERPDTRQHIMAAYIDNPHRLAIQVSRPVDPGEVDKRDIHLVDEQNRRVPIHSILPVDKPCTLLTVATVQPMDVGRHTYVLSLANFAGTATALMRDILDYGDLFYDREALLGAEYAPASTVFRLFAPTAKAVQIAIYDEGKATPKLFQPMRKTGKGIFQGSVGGDLQGKHYAYRLEGPGFAPELDVLDPYCVNRVEHTQRAVVTDLGGTHPEHWESGRQGPVCESPVDMVIYEMHVRDFTVADNSGVRHKGKYLGFTEAGTHLPDCPAISTGLDHLQELGITHVQLLPVQSFAKAADDEAYNWGYMTVAFNTPEAWYATHGDRRIGEFKQLVAALHSRGIGVIMDVVYNHTDYSSPFHSINAKYYYRFTADGHYANGSGVGNDFRTESPMARKYIVDSLKYWVSEYGVDGFRFDLMALIDYDTMRHVEQELRQLKPSIVLYGEPWSAGHSPMKGQPSDTHAIRQGEGIGAFNDHFRNALGGSPDGAEPGFLQQGVGRDKVCSGLEGSCHDWARSPAQTVNYLSCHDNLVLYDKLRWSRPKASEADLLDTMKLGYLLLLTAQGIPFLHGGEEFARSKFGHGNSYQAGDEINRVDWSLKLKNQALFSYTRELIRLRKQHPLFRLRTLAQIEQRVGFLPCPDDRSLVYWVEGSGLAQESWAAACVLVNGGEQADLELPLPPGRWFRAFDLDGPSADGRVLESQVLVRHKSGLIVFRQAEMAAPTVMDEESATAPLPAVENCPTTTRNAIADLN